MLDNDESTFLLLDKPQKEIVITLPEETLINRVLLQEAVATHSERVERHAVDAWIDGQWKEVAQATNIGFKRILRFPEVKTGKIRVRILETRAVPAISLVSAHYYRQRPPQIQAVRSVEGEVTLSPVQDTFSWANWTVPLDQRKKVGFPEGCAVYYTTDGSEPDEKSALYTAPFPLESGEVKAVAVCQGEKGSVCKQRFGAVKKDWRITVSGDGRADHPAKAAIDENPDTYCLTSEAGLPVFTIDLGKAATLSGFAYQPPVIPGIGMASAGSVLVSKDGKKWTKAEDFVFGNLVNDPTKRYLYFSKPVKKVRYVRVEVTETVGHSRSVGVAELDLL